MTLMVFYKNHFFLSDQLWKEDDMNEGKLVNKHFTSWKFKDIEWNSIPTPNEYGYLEDKSNTDMVLDLEKFPAANWGNEFLRLCMCCSLLGPTFVV